MNGVPETDWTSAQPLSDAHFDEEDWHTLEKHHYHVGNEKGACVETIECSTASAIVVYLRHSADKGTGIATRCQGRPRTRSPP